ncbi:MAG: tetratricopeptide repeat protein [Flavobacteriales bacterium]
MILYFMVLSGFLGAQNPRLDSLTNYLSSAKDDSNKVKCLQNLFFEVEFEDVLQAEKYLKEAITIAKKNKFKRGEAYSYICLGYLAEDQSDFQRAITNYQNAYNNYLLINDLRGQSSALKNIAGVYLSKGQYAKALEISLKSLKIAEKLDDKKLISFNYTNVGGIYHGMEEYNKALDYFLKALKISQELGERSAIVSDLSNVGVAYKELENYSKALEFYQESLKIAQEFNKSRSILVSYVNIGGLYEDQNALDQAIEYYNKAEKLALELDDKNTLTVALANIGSLYISLKKYKQSEEYLKRALIIADEIESVSSRKMIHEFLSDLYEETKRFELAHHHFKQFSYLKDTIFNEDKLEDMTRFELTYEFEKKEAVLKAEQEKKQAISNAEKKRQTLFIWFLSSILIAVLAITFLVFRTLKLTRQQKQIIENQKELVEEKQKEILDSIRYAKRIQEALLTSQSYIERNIERLKNI